MSIIINKTLNDIWMYEKNNNYPVFNKLKDQYGVYIFQDSSGNVLYVGEAHKQDLKKESRKTLDLMILVVHLEKTIWKKIIILSNLNH